MRVSHLLKYFVVFLFLAYTQANAMLKYQDFFDFQEEDCIRKLCTCLEIQPQKANNLFKKTIVFFSKKVSKGECLQLINREIELKSFLIKNAREFLVDLGMEDIDEPAFRQSIEEAFVRTKVIHRRRFTLPCTKQTLFKSLIAIGFLGSVFYSFYTAP